MMVAHGHIVSLFNILKQKWINHFEFDSQVVSIFRMKDENDDFDICVLLTDGKIIFINQRENEDLDSEDFSIDTNIDF
jgi:hypothetical protein